MSVSLLVLQRVLAAQSGRGDMTSFTAQRRRGVLYRSIACGQALPANGFKNSAAKVLANVVDAFLKPGALPGGDWTVEEKQWR